MEQIKFTYSDGTTTCMRVFPTLEKSSTTIIIVPAMGVKARFYDLFSVYLRNQGYDVIITELRGHGYSSVRPSKKVDFGYEELITDLKELSKFVRDKFNDSKLVLMGHSLGGQIASLFASRYPNYVNGLILMTACSAYYKGWKRLGRLKLLLAGFLFKSIASIYGFFPGHKLGFAGKESRGVIRDWSHNILKGEYVTTDTNFNYENALTNLVLPILSISFEMDSFTTKIAVENLLNKFNTNSKIEHDHILKNQSKYLDMNHFSWAKKPKTIVKTIDNWLIKLN